jgi:ribosome-associated heat shock protein Hsp15
VTDGADRLRIDRWLWFARVVKTRPLAQALATGGRVRVNGRKIDQASHPVRLGDVLTIGVAGRVRVLRVTGFAERRGSAADASALFEELTAPAGPPAGSADPPSED